MSVVIFRPFFVPWNPLPNLCFPGCDSNLESKIAGNLVTAVVLGVRRTHDLLNCYMWQFLALEPNDRIQGVEVAARYGR